MKKIFPYLFTLVLGAGAGFYAGKTTERAHIITKEEAKQVVALSSAGLLDEVERSVDSASNAPAIREALIVRLANKAGITMYGRQINDLITDKIKSGRRKYDVHPFGKTGSGVNIIVTYTNKSDNETYVLLGRKYNNVNNKSEGLVNQLILLGGYMRPHSLEGGAQRIEDIDEEERDKAEEAILTGTEGYKEVAASAAAGQSPAPVKGSDLEKYDIDLEHNAVRELKEEAGIDWDLESQGYPAHISTRSRYGITNDKRLHTIVGDYLFDFGVLDSPPPASPGSDIGEVVWVKLSDIIKDPTIAPQEYGTGVSRYSVRLNGILVPVRDDHGEVLEKLALKRNPAASQP